MSANWRSLSVSVCLLFSALVAAQPQKTIELDGPSESPQSLFVQSVLEYAYTQLGVDVTYRKVPLARSFVEANKGELDGLRGRVGNIVKDYPNLVKVPFVLLDFRMIMIADRRVCGACLYEQVASIAAPRGFQALEDKIAEHDQNPRVIWTTTHTAAFDLLREGRVEAAIIPDTLLPKGLDTLDHNWLVHTLAVLPDYHYLHHHHQALAESLLTTLTEMEKHGVMATLRQRYGIAPPSKRFDKQGVGHVRAVSASWVDFTDTEDATYWKILRQVYKDDSFGVRTQLANWKRAKQLFLQGEADVLVGAYGFEAEAGTLRSEIHLDYEWEVTAFARDKQQLNDWLAGKGEATACYTLGYDFNEWLPNNIKVYESPSYRECVRLFDANRVDILVDYAIDLPDEFRAAPHAAVVIAERQPLFVVFHDTPRGHWLKQQYETRMAELIRSEQLQSLFPDQRQYHLARFTPQSISR